MRVDAVTKEFKQKALQLYGSRLKDVVLYGSCARGQASANSDIDLAVVLTGEVNPGGEIDRMIDIITDINLDNGVLLSVYPVSDKDYDTLNSPLKINLRAEGIVV
jgi:predicted nucleotidyltransferase